MASDSQESKGESFLDLKEPSFIEFLPPLEEDIEGELIAADLGKQNVASSVSLVGLIC